ncbi:MAG: flagellar brake protein [Sulfuricella sp.]|nr:flagellar brake protein [Sulfuricella sp.]
MNLKPVALASIPVGRPLPWSLYDRNGYTVLARGATVYSRRQLDSLAANGLFRDVDALPPAATAKDEIDESPPEELFPPQGVKPQVWERVQFRVLGRDVQTHYYARLIGYIKGQSILVTVPVAGGQRVVMVDGERVEVRMLTGSNILVFQSSILRVCVSPTHYLHLEYPARGRIQRLRQSPWARMNLAASVIDAQGNMEMGQVVNLSLDGAKVAVPRSVGVKGEPLRLTFRAAVDGQETRLILDSVIQRVRFAKEAGGWPEMLEYGVEFHDIPPKEQLWLNCLVYRRIAEGYLI